jgi:hypothetical protein
MAVRVYEYEAPDLNDRNVEPYNIADRITQSYLRDYCTQYAHKIVMNLSLSEVRDRAQTHCDKWIEEVGLHFDRYSSAQAQDLPQPRGVEDRQIMKHKVYSGDVTGTIAEALFSLLLTNHYKLPHDTFAHLRADRRSGIYPDFAIYTLCAELEEKLKLGGIQIPIQIPVPAEVKSANDPKPRIIKSQIDKGIRQIRNYCVRQSLDRASAIISVAVRNPIQVSYDLITIWGR